MLKRTFTIELRSLSSEETQNNSAELSLFCHMLDFTIGVMPERLAAALRVGALILHGNHISMVYKNLLWVWLYVFVSFKYKQHTYGEGETSSVMSSPEGIVTDIIEEGGMSRTKPTTSGPLNYWIGPGLKILRDVGWDSWSVIRWRRFRVRVKILFTNRECVLSRNF